MLTIIWNWTEKNATFVVLGLLMGFIGIIHAACIMLTMTVEPKVRSPYEMASPAVEAKNKK